MYLKSYDCPSIITDEATFIIINDNSYVLYLFVRFLEIRFYNFQHLKSAYRTMQVW